MREPPRNPFHFGNFVIDEFADREAELADSLARVRERLDRAADAANRAVEEIELLPITKFFPASDVIILSNLGCRAFGESREQEAAAKSAECNSLGAAGPIRWHMVGRIQRNKARSIAGWAYFPTIGAVFALMLSLFVLR